MSCVETPFLSFLKVVHSYFSYTLINCPRACDEHEVELNLYCVAKRNKSITTQNWEKKIDKKLTKYTLFYFTNVNMGGGEIGESVMWWMTSVRWDNSHLNGQAGETQNLSPNLYFKFMCTGIQGDYHTRNIH